MDSTAWNQRYDGSELVWSAAPNVWVEQLTQNLPTGTALDIAAGEGRNSLWLASRGWQVTAADFSACRCNGLAHSPKNSSAPTPAGW